MKFSSFRLLTDDFPRRAYVPSHSATLESTIVKGLHFGQRKLLLSEIEFLSAYLEAPRASDKALLVVYAGAANGSHLPFLFGLFEKVKFVLIDPAPFCAKVREVAKDAEGPVLELVEGYCTDELCLRLSRLYGSVYDILLVSDIRSGEPLVQSNKENTAMIMRDNEMQRSWCLSLKAHAALLKFHPPYPRCKDATSRYYDNADDTPDVVEYMDGSRLFGVWAPKSSSEVRLCVEGPFLSGAKVPMRQYDCTVHEEQCYFYNTEDRYARDCMAERDILSRYLKANPGSYPDGVVSFSNAISKFLQFPLFVPLEPSFTETEARWVTLLYSTRDPKCLEWVKPLRGLMTLNVIRDLAKRYHNESSVPSDVTVGAIALSRDFWRVMCTGDLTEAYGLPRIRWRFAPQIALRVGKRTRCLGGC
ncbi:hypothetical protein TraAM80_00331 [Trypanosoma rangeli]|uniref:Cap-specific mRNA (nucleoside-2'-O-)-methyltransferase n=1 Tax=Trypanosoma rangeli TaxID=5698 RepID=A0A422P442_TRYRA|nr:uncharacterized protein TraAM80_00331 [Trypanosoma rangeli]RNF12478.1 hypothetical protein TraAM80_00331 [Trypanosoma rangeli]|eukprot:RNF12478.1 hypothetical protein TraAM80_00331 [Trypanosoma rangeli]